MDQKEDIEEFVDKLVNEDEINYLANYVKSLLLYKQGKIEECAEYLTKTLDSMPAEIDNKAHIIRQNIIELLEFKPPPRVIILDELKEKYNDIWQESFLLNFMTVHKPQPSTSNYSRRGRPMITTGRITYSEPKPKRKDFFCIICRKPFSKMFSLNRHMLIHEGIKSHTCRFVWISFHCCIC
jgi:hypothetical protein